MIAGVRAIAHLEKKSINEFTEDERIIIALMNALLAVGKSYGVYSDPDDAPDYVYTSICCGVYDLLHAPEELRPKLLTIARELVQFHVEESQFSTTIQSSEKTRQES